MRRQLLPAALMVLVFTVLTGVVYPLAVTGVAQVAFHHKADGSPVKAGGRVVGSRWIGQEFTAANYFHPRPSAVGYDAAASGGSNLGPSNPKLLKGVADRAAAYRSENGLSTHDEVPADAVTASASGLDPDISVANAHIQARRVAAARGLPLAAVLRLVDRHTDGRGLGFLGEPGVNVLALNVALDTMKT
jgi:K+-transporting ATPase ATPase C chain